MKGHLFNVYFLLTLGPLLPKELYGHSMVEIHGDAFSFGGTIAHGSGGQLSIKN